MDDLVGKNIERIAKAIQYKEVIAFVYEGEKYRIEPFILGIHRDTKKPVVKCYHNKAHEAKDNPDNWRLFEIEKMTDVRLTAVRIKDSRIGYTGRDKDFSKILAFI
jgi:hypothetical protein